MKIFYVLDQEGTLFGNKNMQFLLFLLCVMIKLCTGNYHITLQLNEVLSHPTAAVLF
jgi:hypothetical protein